MPISKEDQRERERQRKAELRRIDPERVNRLHREWCAKNKENVAARGRRYRRKNKDKIRDRNREYCRKNKEKVNEYWRKHRSEKPEQHRRAERKYYWNNVDKRRSYYEKTWPARRNKHSDRKLSRIYGISLEHYNAMLAAQGGKCAICGIHHSELKKRLCVDHCHTTLKIRGLLCVHCNFVIGNAKDDIEILKMAIIYLNKAYDRTHATSHT